MKGILKYEGIKLEKGSVAKVTDPLTVEQALQININGNSFTVVMQTPGAEHHLIRGLLYGEDIIKRNTEIRFEDITNKEGLIELVNISIRPEDIGSSYLNSRSLLSVSSCGICGKKELSNLDFSGDSVDDKKKVPLEQIFKLQKIMQKNQSNYSLTGGCHGAAAFDVNGTMLSLKEDIGRHNALDKVIGDLLSKNMLNEVSVITFSGRLSYEIISKCFRAKFPIIAAISAPSTLAIDFAKEYGITILGFTRNEKATCYANAWRIIT